MPAAGALETGLPAFTGGESTEQRLAALYDYVFLLLENLRYLLRNLTPENFNQAELSDWVGKNVTAQTVVSNTVITNELYSDFGAVADLAVDELRTDFAKAARYLAGDQSPLDYLHAHDEVLDFLTGTVARDPDTLEPLTEQLCRGDRLFWWTDGSMTRMTGEKATAWPVTVYRYELLRKGTLRFDAAAENGAVLRVPQLILGAGYGLADADRGRGFLRKDGDSFGLWLLSRAGEKRGLFIGDDYTDLTGLRKTTELNFSGWDAGGFTETVDGGRSASYAVAFDAQARPVKITDAQGHETAVVWD